MPGRQNCILFAFLGKEQNTLFCFFLARKAFKERLWAIGFLEIASFPYDTVSMSPLLPLRQIPWKLEFDSAALGFKIAR